MLGVIGLEFLPSVGLTSWYFSHRSVLSLTPCLSNWPENSSFLVHDFGQLPTELWVQITENLNNEASDVLGVYNTCVATRKAVMECAEALRVNDQRAISSLARQPQLPKLHSLNFKKVTLNSQAPLDLSPLKALKAATFHKVKGISCRSLVLPEMDKIHVRKCEVCGTQWLPPGVKDLCIWRTHFHLSEPSNSSITRRRRPSKFSGELVRNLNADCRPCRRTSRFLGL